MDFYLGQDLKIFVSLQEIGFVVFLLVAVFLSVRLQKLTLGGGITGGIIALCIYAGAGLTGVTILGAFFLLGTLATSFGEKTKQTIGAAEHNKGRRTAGQVIANGGVAALAGMIAYCLPHYSTLMILAMAASLSSAAADTLSSELGTVFGRRFYNIFTFRKDIRGENGVVSLEGTLCGIAGSTLIALIHAAGFGFSDHFFVIVISGTIGNITDSLLGATLERRGKIGNNAVNLANTLAAALTAGLLFLI